mmetsp:Transcript_46862/g.123793  ORF Transcript_46862/g.123793 Transcript_46862/m.123793 type:complete len:241 (+) Transcript_46862:1013-1735(+)
MPAFLRETTSRVTGLIGAIAPVGWMPCDSKARITPTGERALYWSFTLSSISTSFLAGTRANGPSWSGKLALIESRLCPRGFLTWRLGNNEDEGRSFTPDVFIFSCISSSGDKKPLPILPRLGRCAAREASRIMETSLKPACTPLSAVSRTQKSKAKPQAKILLIPRFLRQLLSSTLRRQASTSGGALMSALMLLMSSNTQPVHADNEQPCSRAFTSRFATRLKVDSSLVYWKEPKESTSS